MQGGGEEPMPSVSPARGFLGCSWASDEEGKRDVLGTRHSGPDLEVREGLPEEVTFMPRPEG